MHSTEIASFVERLKRNSVDYDEFSALTSSDWEAITGLLGEQNQSKLQQYVNAVARLKKRSNPKWKRPRRTYLENDILAEFSNAQRKM